MIRVNEAIDHFKKLFTSGAIYVWGANCEIITPQLMDKLYKNFNSKTYNKKYYDNKLKEGLGRIGADCSGSMFPLSGRDNTAQGYFNDCIIKGAIKCINKDKACLVFKGSSMSKINHIGFYCGDGYVIEMKSSKDNCVRSKLDGGSWKWYGIPTWINYNNDDEPVLKHGDNNLYVYHWQRFLSLLELYNGEIDGIFGDKTEQAVCKYQKKYGLTIDGIIGPQCWNKSKELI